MDKITFNKQFKAVVNLIMKDSCKTDIDSQIKAIEVLNENLTQMPVFVSIIQSLKELRAIKRKENG
jgi:hypothetical protein